MLQNSQINTKLWSFVKYQDKHLLSILDKLKSKYFDEKNIYRQAEMRVFISFIGYYKCTWVYHVRICFITFFVYETTKLFLMFRSFDTYDLTHARKYNYKRIISQFSKKLKKKTNRIHQSSTCVYEYSFFSKINILFIKQSIV